MSSVSSSARAERRRLSFSEDGFVRFPRTEFVIDVVLEGSLDIPMLREAYFLLRREFPALAGRTEAVGEGFDLVVDGKEAAQEQVFLVRAATGGESDSTPPHVDVEQTMGVLDVVTGESWHRVMFAMNHALGDGEHEFALFFRLWELYTSLVETGRAEVAPPQPMPQAPQTLLEARGVRKGPSTGRERVDEVVWSGSMPSAEDLPDGVMGPVHGRLVLEREASEALQAKAKSVGLSVNSLVCGAILSAERTAFAEDGDVTLGLMTLVSGRQRVSPPVGRVEVTNFVGASYLAVPVGSQSDPVVLGRQVQEQLRDDLESGLCLQPMLAPVDVREIREPAIVCSGLGAMPEMVLPAGLRMADMTCYLHFEVAASEVALSDRRAGVRLPALSASVYQVWRIGGCLRINMLNLSGTLSDAARQGILAEIERTCRRLADQKECSWV